MGKGEREKRPTDIWVEVGAATTQLYTDEIELDGFAVALAAALEARNRQASPDLATLEAAVQLALQDLQWRRRESNPRPRTHRDEHLQA